MERFVAYSFALLASLLYPYDQRLKQADVLRPLRFVGGMSYSVYLCHPLMAKGISFAFFRAGVYGNAETLLLRVAAVPGGLAAGGVHVSSLDRTAFYSEIQSYEPTGSKHLNSIQCAGGCDRLIRRSGRLKV